MIQIAADLAKLYTSFMEQKGVETEVAFNQAVFSNRKIIPQTSKPCSDTNMATGQSGSDWTEVFNEGGLSGRPLVYKLLLSV